jgi:hypothetical protein
MYNGIRVSDPAMVIMQIQDLSEYERMRDEGATPQEVYLSARNQGVDQITGIRILRSIFNLDLLGAKEITIQARGWANSLDEYQEKLFQSIDFEKLMDSINEDTD